MSGRVWHNGPPPHAGWWNASVNRDRTIWRWWDDEFWSQPAHQGDHNVVASTEAMTRTHLESDHIQWSRYWPKLARVKRVKP